MRQRALCAVAALAALASLAVPPGAQAAAVSDSEELFRVGSTGEGAGQLKLPAGVASDPATGHIYVVEEEPYYRVDEFTPWGKFVKAFGWDVAPGAVNEQQEVRVRASAGQFKLSFEGQPTADLAFNAKASEVEAALSALPAIGAGGVSVEGVPGAVSGATPFIYVITFKGPKAGANVPQLAAANGATPLSGGTPSTQLEARTRADGTPGGAGLEACTAESGCKAGLQGGGRGQLDRARGVAIDGDGSLYIREVTNHRVQKFDSAGRFLLMLGGEVNKTKAEAAAPEAEQSICPVDPGDACQAGTAGAGNGQFEAGLSGGVALCKGSLFAADLGRIQRFSLAGAFEAAAPVPGETVQSLACDPVSGDLYATFEAKQNVHRLDSATGAEVGEIEAEAPGGLAIDSAGNLFVAAGGKVLELDSDGEPLTPPSCCEAPSGVRVSGLGINSAGNLHVAYESGSGDNFIRVFGPPPVAFESAPLVPPEITAQFASSVQRDGATVAADINPHFFTDARYYVQYGTGKCSEGGCPEEAPLPPGALLTPKVTGSTVRTAGVSLEGLAPGTAYHYRFIAQSTGGGPSYGIDPDGAGPKGASPAEGKEAAFTTFPEPLPAKACPNDAFRLGPAARLPGCRAYEMVSPVDKNNGDIRSLLDFPGFGTSLSKSAEAGGKLAYSTFRSFGDPQGAPYTNQYLATRGQGGWSSEPLSAPKTSHFSGSAFENPYKAFTPDLCSGWLLGEAEPPLAPGAPAGYLNLYRREGCGQGGYEALIQAEPASGNKSAFTPVLQGASADGKAAVLAANDKLTPDAASGPWQAYYASGGQLALLCVGPGGLASGGNCSPGTGPLPAVPFWEHFASVANALSADGAKAYWTDSAGNASGPGKVYVRLNPGAAQSALSGGECVEPEKACTLRVSETVTPQASRFLLASRDGAKALFEVTQGASAGKLFKFDLATESSTEIAGKALGVAGASDGLSRVYFASEEALAGTTGATAGKPNLYLDEEGARAFIATTSKEDAIARIPSNVPHEPVFHAARATADGRVLAFISTESLTGYDNADLASGAPDSEAYIYEAGSAGPVCVSCNPSGARPTGRLLQGTGNSSNSLWTAGSLPTPEGSLYSPRALSADGRRLFFNSFDALLPRDTNGKEDVYAWESAGSQQACAELGAELYAASAAGCLSLISSGESPQDSEFLDASADGADAFFTTNSSLLPQDPGLIDVYDARIGGGFPPAPAPPPACQGEACQPPVSAPSDSTPSSSSYEGPEDQKPKKKKKHKKKKHKKQHKKQGKQNGKKQGGRR